MSFDEKAYFQKEIAPLIKQIRNKCLLTNISFFFVACVGNDNNDTKYVTEILSPATVGTKLTKDYFTQLILASKGIKNEFYSIPKIMEKRLEGDEINRPMDFQEDEFPDIGSDEIVDNDFDDDDEPFDTAEYGTESLDL